MKLIQNEKGEFVSVPYTSEELAAMQPSPYQLALEAWNSKFDWKVIVPADWLEDPQFYGVSSWATHNKDKMEIRVIGESAHVYFYVLKDNHKTMLTNLGLTPMPKPVEKDFE